MPDTIEKHTTRAQVISALELYCEHKGPIVGLKLWTPIDCYSGVFWAEDPDVNKFINNWLGGEDFAKVDLFYTATRRLMGQWHWGIGDHEFKRTITSSTPEEFLQCTAEELEEAARRRLEMVTAINSGSESEGEEEPCCSIIYNNNNSGTESDGDEEH